MPTNVDKSDKKHTGFFGTAQYLILLGINLMKYL